MLFVSTISHTHKTKCAHIFESYTHEVHWKISSPIMREIKWNKCRYMFISWKSYKVENVKCKL